MEGAERNSDAPVSVVILTLDEAINIRACIESCAWCNDVHVLDSGSSDGTREIASECGASVWEHPFESFGAQRNWAIDNIPTRHDWIFHLDADERFTPELVEELRELFRSEPDESGFLVPNKLMFMGRWLKRAGGYPTYQMRLFHKGRTRFVDHGHGQREEEGARLGRLREPYLHYNFSKGLDEWFDKHNRYSRKEAEQALVAVEPLGESLGRLFSLDSVRRRRGMKSLSYRLPMRPLLAAIYQHVVKLGVLDGPAGWTYIAMRKTYDQMITIKLAELKQRAAREEDA